LKSNAPLVIQPIQAHLDISFACITTLIRGFDLLRLDDGHFERKARIATGAYRLLPYALEYWIEHCLLYATNEILVDLNQLLLSRLTQLRVKHDQLLQGIGNGETSHPNACDTSKVFENKLENRTKLIAHLPIHDLIRRVLHVRWLTSQQLCKNGEGKRHLGLSRHHWFVTTY